MNIIVALLILSIIVIIHELGHFLLARSHGVTVTEFSVGMGPRIASFVRKGTRYSLKLLPIGGSCMMLGEDENIEDEGAFNKKGPWARFSILFAGAFFNFILAFILAVVVLGDVGVDKPYITRLSENGPAMAAGLKEGDLITKINGSGIHFARDIKYSFYFNHLSEKPIEVKVLREGEKHTFSVVPVWRDIYQIGFNYTPGNSAAVAEVIVAGYPLEKAGMQVGDAIVAMNGVKISTSQELADYLAGNPLGAEPVTLTYARNGQETEITVTPILVQSGFDLGWSYNEYGKKVNALEVVKYGFFELKSNVVNTVKSIVSLIIGKVSVKEVAGPGGIVNVVGDIVSESKAYGLRTTLLSLAQFAILLSANLGVMNLLPIPALDGGRIVFIIIEAIRRKPVPREKEAIVHLVGMALLMLLMVLVAFNDIRNIFQ